MQKKARLIQVARGKAPADLLLKDAWVLDVFSGGFSRRDVAVADGWVIGYGAREAREVVDLSGKYLVPGFIDTHVHIESSQLSPAEFARAVVPHGTTCLIADPHEIANVLGLVGIRYMLSATEGLPFRVFFMAPSCVPASPFETAGAELSAEELREVLSWKRVLGLGELMNFPGAISDDPEVRGKVQAAARRPVDGHAPGLSGPKLWAYVLAGPRTEHECTSLSEAQEKLSTGMHILIREGTTARNLTALLPLLSWRTVPFLHFCTDDRHPETLLSEGHMDDVLRKAIAGGISPELAFGAATIHAARAYGLLDLGAIAPGYRADLVVLSDPERVAVERVYVGGELVAQGGRLAAPLPPQDASPVRGTVRVDLKRLSFRIPAGAGKARAIGVVPGQAVTEEILVEARAVGGEVVSDPERDLLKLAVVERHRGTGNVGLGLVRGFGLKRGALASTVAHDSHNIVVVGGDDEDMRVAVEALVKLGGGQVVVAGGEVLAELPLPIAGLMSDRPWEDVARAGRELIRAARELGCGLSDPFMQLSFLALPVIPKLKLTDRGLVDVSRFCHVPLFASEGDQ
ncbi:TPA: adenine deaminase [Candidatus Acetothermia bacterium]|nr:adenine deaminase [Candidatus Acetothermia bacterium]